MGKHGGMYKSTKRKKEVARQKKQEEKRLKRLNKGSAAEQPEENIPEETAENAGAE